VLKARFWLGGKEKTRAQETRETLEALRRTFRNIVLVPRFFDSTDQTVLGRTKFKTSQRGVIMRMEDAK